MTRKTRREIEREIDDLATDADDGPGVVIFIGRFSPSSTNERYQVTVEKPEEDPIDSYTEPAIPNYLPPSYRGGVTTLDDDDLRVLWDEMPEDIREKEREYRRKHDEPIPPVLAED